MFNRYDKIKATLSETDGIITEDEAMNLLSNVVLNYQHKTLKHQVITLWSAVYNCSKKEVLLCAGMDYDKKYRLSIDDPGKIERV